MKFRLDTLFGCVMVAVFLVAAVPASETAYQQASPARAVSDTFTVQADSILSRAVSIRGARVVALQVPTLDATDLSLVVGYAADSTFVPLHIKTDAGDSLAAFTLHSGTGLFGIDITQWVSGFAWFKVVTADSMSAIRTFNILTKY